jgi:hypothetical protein
LQGIAIAILCEGAWPVTQNQNGGAHYTESRELNLSVFSLLCRLIAGWKLTNKVHLLSRKLV